MSNTSKGLLLAFAILTVLVGLPVGFVVWKTGESIKTMKPYTSYVRLVNLADGFDDYKKKNGEWPADITQLVIARPDLGNDITDGYDNAVVLISYSEAVGYGEFISYGRDGKPDGDNRYDQDIVIRFPTDTETNAQWNKQVADRFKSRASRGLW